MTMTKYTGGCACGAIHYETSSKPIVESHRHGAWILSGLPPASRREHYG
jgi:hypothetical protein